MDDINISYEIENVDIDKILKHDVEMNFDVFEEVKENYDREPDPNQYYIMLEALDYATQEDGYRTLYDRYWKRFYNQKAENYDTDVLQLRFT